jgi:ribonuclease-3
MSLVERIVRRLWPAATKGELRSFQRRLGYEFRDDTLLRLALTHRSYAHENQIGEQNERLEFLGDSVLGLVSGEHLFARHPDLPEGQLSRRRSFLVSEPTLARMAAEIRLGRVMRLGIGEDRSGGRDKPSLLADSLEAVFGAVFLDGGLKAARKVIRPLLDTEMESSRTWDKRDHKTRLQEQLQSVGGGLPRYFLVEEEGPDHAKTFTVECRQSGEVLGQGSGSSKKGAEQDAARNALTQLDSLDPSEGPP